ncbi:MAG: hypothetical protein LBL17_04680 [Coxiellaceae bacterium]|jgi:hypothetical protein|nr:hypothetical protein [Coxiellaceae bacterium]
MKFNLLIKFSCLTVLIFYIWYSKNIFSESLAIQNPSSNIQSANVPTAPPGSTSHKSDTQPDNTSTQSDKDKKEVPGKLRLDNADKALMERLFDKEAQYEFFTSQDNATAETFDEQ